jgi:hypothetical protein
LPKVLKTALQTGLQAIMGIGLMKLDSAMFGRGSSVPDMGHQLIGKFDTGRNMMSITAL